MDKIDNIDKTSNYQNITSFMETVPLFALFIFLLIVASAYILNTFPCKVQKAVNNNMFLRHFIGVLVMIFFVIITAPLKEKNISTVIKKSILLYIIFIFYSKVEVRFFIITFIMLGITYLLMLQKYEFIADLNLEKDVAKKEKLNKYLSYIIYINNFIFVLCIILIVIGFLSYMGKKKYQYKDKFNYVTFLLGTQECTDRVFDIPIRKSFKYSFN